MKIGPQLMERVGQVLAPFEFAYVGQLDQRSWRFDRLHRGAMQSITFLLGQENPGALSAQYGTEVGLASKGAWEFAPGKEQERWWWFYDEAGCAAALDELLAITIAHGIPWLESHEAGLQPWIM
jgi:hypothetical protein